MLVSLIESLMCLNDLPPDLEIHKIAIRNYFHRCIANHCVSVSIDATFGEIPTCRLDLTIPMMYNQEKCPDPDPDPEAAPSLLEPKELPLNRFSGMQVDECNEI